MRERGSLFALMIAFSFAFPALGDEPAATETVIRLSVSPAPAPKPALKYQLLPELREMQPGNAVPAFYKCLMEQQNLYYKKSVIADRDKYLNCPLSELKGKDLTNYGWASTRQADYAARLETADWAILPQIRTEGMRLAIPDVQVLRSVALALKVRFRAQVAEGDYPAAIETAKTMFALARTFSEHPTLIGGLVGTAIANLTIGPLEEMIGQPNSPNLYWALTNLPESLVDFRKGWQGERTWIFAEFPGVFDDPTPKSEDVLAKYIARFDTVAKNFPPNAFGGEKTLSAWLAKVAKDEAYMRDVRKRLVQTGLTADQAERMPAKQAVLLDEYHKFETVQDEIFKWLPLPLWQAQPALDKLEKPTGVFSEMLPAASKVKQAHARLAQRLASVRIIEAIRLYAAAHDGKLPDSLDRIEVPLPVDPITGKAFHYEVKDGTAILHGTPPAGMEKSPAYVRYEITIRK